MAGEARRVTVYKASDGWRWRAQGGNWRIVGAAEEGKQHKKRVVDAVVKLFPHAEILVED